MNKEKATVTLPQIDKVSTFLRKMQFYSFIKGIDKVYNEKVEIFVGNHVGNNKTLEKMTKITDDFNPFINENEWVEFLDTMEDYFHRVMAEEKNK